MLDEHGQPVVRLTVLVASERFGLAARMEGSPAPTDARGAFECEGLDAGAHRVFADAPGYAPAEQAVVAPGSLEIHLEPSSAAVARIPALPSREQAPVEN